MSGTIDLGAVRGADGADGLPGKSAYQYAVDGGYTGTEDEFKALLAAGPWLPTAGGTVTGPVYFGDSAAAIWAENELIRIVAEGGGPVTIGDGYIDGLTGTPVTGTRAVSKNYADGAYLKKAGDTATGDLSMGNHKLTGLADPTAPGDAASKSYVDASLSSGVPPGVIALWSGAANAIPSGWHLCDGTEGTPDLRDRFVVGAGGSYSVGDTGGSDTVTLTVAQMPVHGHSAGSLYTSSAGSHSHSYTGKFADDGRYGISNGANDVVSSLREDTYTTGSGGSHTHDIYGSLSSAGSGESHENRPPYYALCYIMKLAASTLQEVTA